MAKINQVSGRGIYLRGDDIDTDQIIPARFMKEITFDSLGRYAFHDLRYAPDGQARPHPFNDPRFAGASILVVNRNFGCGSSREHAPQALIRSGIKAIIGESFAEIFAGNCIANGVPVVSAAPADIANLMRVIEESPVAELRLDLVGLTLDYGDFQVPVEIGDASRKSLVEGTWDTLAEMLGNLPAARERAAALPYPGFRPVGPA
jgi:3-isopropylmalate/(R)-2-methylmalate dehydratase small subunit